MKKYHITVIGYYQSSDTTHQTIIECDGMSYSTSGVYEFWIGKDSKIPIAYYPIRQTIITKIEQSK
jgi:thiamine biosynthesis lipoprotein ApbE